MPYLSTTFLRFANKKVLKTQRERERERGNLKFVVSVFLISWVVYVISTFLSLAKPEIVFWNFPRTKNQPQNCPRIDFFTGQKLGENLTTKYPDN